MSGGVILFIDAYDSFSNNIINLLQQELSVSVERIYIDDPRFVLNDDAFESFLKQFDGVVTGPGPGHPGNQEDIGLISKVWQLKQHALLPTLGICLGFQSLCLSEGAEVARLRDPRHGIVTRITHRSNGVFRGIGTFEATQYHSLQVQLKLEGGCNPSSTRDIWCNVSNLTPLAWDLTDANNGPILMAVEHIQKPFMGVQFHPESICTSAGGKQLIRNWWRSVYSWNAVQKKQRWTNLTRSNGLQHLGQQQQHHHHHRHLPPTRPPAAYPVSVQHHSISVPRSMTARDIVNLVKLRHSDYEPIVLQSSTQNGKLTHVETGRFSIIGLHGSTSTHIRYACSTSSLTVAAGETIILSQRVSINGAFDFLQRFLAERRACTGPAEIPFWGGLVGYTSYEAGLATIDVPPIVRTDSHPDMWFVFVERSIVLDHKSGTAYVQSIRAHDGCWLQQTAQLLDTAVIVDEAFDSITQSPVRAQVLSEPEADLYCQKVNDCQEHLRAGSSYELCLTGQTTLSSMEQPWQIFCRLSELNPAPFGAYVNLDAGKHSDTGVTVVGSSPERFLSWSREGRCQFRPIKGTVPKAPDTTREQAELILRSQKETAENLMIVDLIRHDLTGVDGVSNVHVPQLMAVEEYATVYQLVSVIEGDLAPERSGITVLAASLPPGSMTGAPKKRSCVLLQDIEEHKARGLYSGVIGYLDIGGGGDFSVVIRTAFRWKGEDEWRVGAGGAVTILSTPDGEYDEMLIKRERLVDVFLRGSGGRT